MASTDSPSPAFRLAWFSVFVVVLMFALFTRLWFLQVLAGERYAQLAERNRVRFVLAEAPRGRILDRHGQEIVKSRPALTVSADPRRLLGPDGHPRDVEAAAVLKRLAALLGLEEEEVRRRLGSRKYSPFRAVPIQEDVPPEVVFTIEERQELYPGVVAETLPVRAYPHGAVAAHVVGYIGEITEEQLKDPTYRDYRLGDLVGKAGLEAGYERWLQGQEGWRKLEVNARDHVVDVLDYTPPVPGADLRTTIDLKLQVAVERALAEGIEASRTLRRPDGRTSPSVAGAAVVLDPATGEVLAMASNPTYDPAAFVGGVSQADWAWLNDPRNTRPLLNRAVQAAYPPGSTFKIVSAASALDAGLVTPATEVPCPPVWGWGKRNWISRDEGPLNVSEALMRSCDTYFYELSFRQWRAEERAAKAGRTPDEALQRMAATFGFGRRLGIDLPDETTGVVPGREWRQRVWAASREANCARAETAAPESYAKRLYTELCSEEGRRWRGGDAVNMSIGQGSVLATPLQVAAAFAAVANGGSVYRPHLGAEVVAADGSVLERVEPQVLGTVGIDPADLAAIRRGLEMVVLDERGTAHEAFAQAVEDNPPFPLDRIPVAGKTGTSEVGGDRIPHAWFAAYAPAHDPRYVVAVAVEEGGGGSMTAAPIARRVLEAAFDLPVSPFRFGPRGD